MNIKYSFKRISVLFIYIHMKNREISHRDDMAFNVVYCRSSVRNNGAIMAKFYGLICFVLFRISQRRANSRTSKITDLQK